MLTSHFIKISLITINWSWSTVNWIIFHFGRWTRVRRTVAVESMHQTSTRLISMLFTFSIWWSTVVRSSSPCVDTPELISIYIHFIIGLNSLNRNSLCNFRSAHRNPISMMYKVNFNSYLFTFHNNFASKCICDDDNDDEGKIITYNGFIA